MTGLNLVEVGLCPVCGGPGGKLYEGLQDLLFGVPGHWALHQCHAADCGAVWANPRVSDEDIPAIYRTYYTHDREGSEAAPKRGAWTRCEDLVYTMLGVWRARHELYGMFLQDRPVGHMLELGCGNGDRLSYFRSKGWTVLGQEVDPVAAGQARAKGHEVFLGDIAQFPKEPRFDVIVMNHVLEHIPHPHEFVESVRVLLKPDGLVVAVTPNAKSFLHGVFGRNWRGLEPPRHFVIYGERSAHKLFTKAGFDRVKVFSSAANTQLLWNASVLISRRSGHAGENGPGVFGAISAFLVQLVAMIGSRLRLLEGEELIIVAKRP